MHNYRDFILRELERRQKKNPSYSLRAFARDLEMPSSRLSEILNRKMGLSEARAINLAERLNLSQPEKEYFIDLALSEHARSAVMKEMALRRVKARTELMSTIETRDLSGLSEGAHIAIQIKREQYAHALEKIKTFQEQLAKDLEAPTESDSVYNLTVRLIEPSTTNE
jgi:plasmid maintenance system antidote protein VapI